LDPTVQTILQQGLALNPDQRSQTIKAWLSPLLAKSKETVPPAAVVAEETPLSALPAAQSLDQSNAEVEDVSPPPTQKLSPLTAKGLLPVMATTSAIAFSAGIGFGLAVRLNRPQVAGASILHQEQSFPPREAWPVSRPGIKNAEMIESEATKIRTIDSLPDS
jgi:hypothetical protein